MAKKRQNDGNIDEQYYQISPEILSSFPKYHPPVDLFSFREDIAVLAPYCRKGQRLNNDQVKELADLCANDSLFVARSDHHIYSKHIVKQLDLVLQDDHLTDAEIVDICIRALLLRLREFFDQPVKNMFEALYKDAMVVTEYIWEDKHRINTFVRRLFHKDELARHALNTMIVGLRIWMYSTAEYRRKELDRITLALLLHDIGMSKVPAFLLKKAGPLRMDEREKILPHALLGAKMMQKIDVRFDELVHACFQHHERMDGSGYPQHSKDLQISRVGRLTAVADSFSAMICERPWRKPKEIITACKELLDDYQRYDQEMASTLMGVFATGNLGQMIDMDAIVDTKESEE
ncbi:MAG: HD domain-containing protein [Desulfovibrio sp.]|nr:HD domain-containing protein [Desulfovibrio sp.]